MASGFILTSNIKASNDKSYLEISGKLADGRFLSLALIQALSIWLYSRWGKDRRGQQSTKKKIQISSRTRPRSSPFSQPIFSKKRDK